MPPTLVIPVQHSPFNTAKSYLLVGQRVVVVDTGPPDGGRRGDRVRRALEACGRSRHDVTLILATHAHPDHVGNAVGLRGWSSAPIAIDPREAAFVEGRAVSSRTPTGLAGRLFLLTPFPYEEFDHFTPDLLVDDHSELRHFG